MDHHIKKMTKIRETIWDLFNSGKKEAAYAELNKNLYEFEGKSKKDYFHFKKLEMNMMNKEIADLSKDKNVYFPKEKIEKLEAKLKEIANELITENAKSYHLASAYEMLHTIEYRNGNYSDAAEYIKNAIKHTEHFFNKHLYISKLLNSHYYEGSDKSLNKISEIAQKELKNLKQNPAYKNMPNHNPPHETLACLKYMSMYSKNLFHVNLKFAEKYEAYKDIYLPEAIDYALENLEYNTKLGDNKNKASAHINLSKMYLMQGDFNNSIIHANRALEAEPNKPAIEKLGALYKAECFIELAAKTTTQDKRNTLTKQAEELIIQLPETHPLEFVRLNNLAHEKLGSKTFEQIAIKPVTIEPSEELNITRV
jgi:tetratricopeptide (TPR) repeat protein